MDEFVDIRWWHAVVPFTGGYERIWLGLGAIALDLLLVVTVSSLLRHRLSRRTWCALHQSVYLLWLASDPARCRAWAPTWATGGGRSPSAASPP